jgi:glycosyltransferase involved in cell wall biosynthesis
MSATYDPQVSRPAVLHALGSSDAEGVTLPLVMSTTATRAVVVRFGTAGGPLPVGPAIDAVSLGLATDPNPAELVRLARRNRAAVLHAHDVAAARVVGPASSATRWPWFGTIAESDLERPDLAVMYSSAAAVIVSSDRLASELRSLGLGDDRIRVGRAGELGAQAADLDELYLAAAARIAIPLPRRYAESDSTVSVVVATFNRSDLVARTIECLLAQTYPAELVEIVVVDDHSTDGTAETLAGLASDRVRVLQPPAKGYAAGARNHGVAHARGEIICFTDDDCRPEPLWLEALVAGFAEGIDLVQGRTRPDPDQPRGRWSRTISTPREYGLYETANLGVRRSAVLALDDQPFNPQVPGELRRVLGRSLGTPGIGEDVDFGWRVRRRGGTRFASHAVVRHQVFDGSPGMTLRDAVRAAGFPLLVRRVPELRRAFFWHRWFLRSAHLALLVAIIAVAVAATVSPYAAVGAAPYLWLIVRPERRGRLVRLRRAPFAALRDLVEVGGCLAGSVYSRRLVI